MSTRTSTNSNPFFSGLDDVSSGNTTSNSEPSSNNSEPPQEVAEPPQEVVVRSFTMTVSGFTFLGRHGTDRMEHRVDIGLEALSSNPNLACVRMSCNAGSESFNLEWVGWQPSCSANRPLPQGREGTLLMLVASLKVMLRMFEPCNRIDLMDTSKKEFEVPRVSALDRMGGARTVKVPLGDLYSITHFAANDGPCVTWYMAALGGVPSSAETHERLEMNAIVLRRVVTMSGASFCDACFSPAASSRDARWLAKASAAIERLVDDAAKGRRTWGALFAEMTRAVGGAPFAFIIPRLPELLYGWRSVYGCAFAIHGARERVMGMRVLGVDADPELHFSG